MSPNSSKAKWTVAVSVMLAVGTIALLWIQVAQPPAQLGAMVLPEAAPQEIEAPREPESGPDDAPPRTTVAPVSPTNGEAATSRQALPEATVVSIRVVAREDHAPISGARASIKIRRKPLKSGPVRAPVDREAKTGVDGIASLRVLPNAGYTLKVSSPYEGVDEFVVEVAPLLPGAIRTVEVDFPTRDDLRLRGKVVTDEDGMAIEGATIRLRSVLSARDGRTKYGRPIGFLDDPTAVQPAALTGTDGRFELAARSWQRQFARVDAPGRAPAIIASFHGRRRAGGELEIRLSRSAALQVRVTDADSGAPRAGVDVRVATRTRYLGQDGPPSAAAPDWLAWQALTASDGACRLEGLPPEAPFLVQLLLDGKMAELESVEVVLAAGEVRPLELHLGDTFTVSGRLVDQHGAPIDRCTVSRMPLWRGTQPREAGAPVTRTTTSSDGRFEFTEVSAGTWSIATASEDARASGDERMAFVSVFETVEVGPNLRELVLVAQRGIVIAGRVLGSDGEPASNAAVELHSRDGGPKTSASCDHFGRFLAGPFSPGEYVATAHIRRVGSLDAPSQPTLVEAGREDVVLRLERGASVRCRLVGLASHEEVEIVPVLARLDGSGCFEHHPPDDGSEQELWFRFDRVSAGGWSLGASAQDGRCAVLTGLEIATGETADEIVLELRPGGLLRIRCAGGVGSVRVRVVAGNFEWESRAVAANGQIEVFVPPGPVIVGRLVDEPCGWEDRTVEVAAGALCEVTVAPVR